MRLIELTVPEPDVELVEDRCWMGGAEGIWESGAGPSAGTSVLRVGVEDAAAPTFVAALADLDPVDVTATTAVDLAARHLVVEVGATTLALTVPATVFGDGLHPTTAACLAHVDALVGPGQRFLDVGCGSGVLSLLAATQGAHVVAIDRDETAVTATIANARSLGLRCDASTRSLDAVTGLFDVVVANISAAGLAALAPDLTARIGPAGRLVLSGMLEHQWDDVRPRFPDGSPWTTAVVDGWLTACSGPYPSG